MFSAYGFRQGEADFPKVRVPADKRNFSSPAIEKAIADFKAKVKDPELGWLFDNCFPNTLDTTVFLKAKGKVKRFCGSRHAFVPAHTESPRRGAVTLSVY